MTFDIVLNIDMCFKSHEMKNFSHAIYVYYEPIVLLCVNFSFKYASIIVPFEYAYVVYFMTVIIMPSSGL